MPSKAKEFWLFVFVFADHLPTDGLKSAFARLPTCHVSDGKGSPMSGNPNANGKAAGKTRRDSWRDKEQRSSCPMPKFPNSRCFGCCGKQKRKQGKNERVSVRP